METNLLVPVPIYNLLGRLSQITYANSVIGVYAYDMLDRLDKLTQYLPDSTPGDLSDNVIAAQDDYTVALDGTRTALTEMILRDPASGGGYATSFYTWTYDNLNRLMSEVITSTETGVSREEHYAYDLAGNRLYKGPTPWDGYGFDGTVYFYDANDRLSSHRTYQEDFFGNFTQIQTTYTYASNGTASHATSVVETTSGFKWEFDNANQREIQTQFQTTVTTAYTFDLQGRLTAQAQNTHTHLDQQIYWWNGDIDNVTSDTTHSSDAAFSYDDSGIRVYSSQVTTDTQGTSQTTATLYLVDHQNPTGYAQVLEERTATAASATIPYVDALFAVTKAYVLGMDVVQQWTPANASQGLPGADNLVILPDGHGSTRLLLASATGVVASGLLVPNQLFFYDAWGNTLAPVGATTPLTSLLYTGEQKDAATGMYYLRARYYNPGLGRFSSMDPWGGRYGSRTNFNGFIYTSANPTNRIDPTGMFSAPFGYAVETEVQNIYSYDHPHDSLSFGKVIGGLKPDILNLTAYLWAEVKPLSTSGIAKAVMQGGAYASTLGLLGYSPDASWSPSTDVLTIGGQTIVIFNVGGIIFYTDIADSAADVAMISSIALARQYLRNNIIKSTKVGVTTKTSVDGARLNTTMSIASLLAIFGIVI